MEVLNLMMKLSEYHTYLTGRTQIELFFGRLGRLRRACRRVAASGNPGSTEPLAVVPVLSQAPSVTVSIDKDGDEDRGEGLSGLGVSGADERVTPQRLHTMTSAVMMLGSIEGVSNVMTAAMVRRCSVRPLRHALTRPTSLSPISAVSIAAAAARSCWRARDGVASSSHLLGNQHGA